MRAGIYTRLSEAKSSVNATEDAVERQERRGRDLCSANGWTVVAVYSDVDIGAYRAAGRKAPPRRDDFERMLADAKDGRLDAIVFSKVDRLVRDHSDFERVLKVCEQFEVKLAAVLEPIDTTTPTGETMARMMVLFARMESLTTGLRIAEQRRQAAYRGEPNSGGRRPFGYAKGRIAIIEDEADVIREAARRIYRGDSVRSVTAWANTVSTGTTGQPWTQGTLRPMLLSPGIAGLRTYHGQLHEATWPRILDRTTWEAVHAVLQSKTRPGASGRSGKFLLSGLCACGRCGATLDVHYEPKARGGRRQYYCTKHPGRKGCGRLQVAADPLESMVSEMVLHVLTEPRRREALTSRLGGDPSALADKKEAESRLLEVEEMYGAGEIDRPEYLRHRKRLTERIRAAQALLAKQPNLEVLADLPRSEKRLREWWSSEDTSLEQKRTVMRALVTRIIVGPSSRGNGPRFDPRRLAPPYGPQWRA